MRKMIFSVSAVAIAFTAFFVWSHSMLTPLKASSASSISPTDVAGLMTHYRGPLPIERWDAI
jgi:hypothetical protein